MTNRGECGYDPDLGFSCGATAITTDSAHAFTYDKVGNRTSQGGVYDSLTNRIQTFGSWTTFSHDADGNMTTKSKTGTTYDYRWTAAGLMDSVRVAGTWNHLYYDAFGRFVGWNQGTTKIRRLVWEGGNLLVETNGAMTTKEGEYSYVPGALDVLHAYIDGPGTEQHYAHPDGGGNVVATTTSGKVLKQSLAYDVWGKKTALTEPTGYEQRAWWKGALAFQRANEFNLTYMRNRWYDPDLGRFTSEDPIGFTAGNNFYLFASNDPANGFDPMGLQNCPKCLPTIHVFVEGTDGGGGLLRNVWRGFLRRLAVGRSIYSAHGGGGNYAAELAAFRAHHPDPTLLRAASFAPCFTAGALTAASAATDGTLVNIGRGVVESTVSGVAKGWVTNILVPNETFRPELAAAQLAWRDVDRLSLEGVQTYAQGVPATVAGNGLLGSVSPWDFVPVVGFSRSIGATARTCF